MDLVELEDVGTMYKFLDDSLCNQPKVCIVSDLKDEYHLAIEKVGGGLDINFVCFTQNKR